MHPINSENRRFYYLTLTQLLITIILLSTNSIYFATNDDTTMVDIVSGGYGEPSPYIVNIHVIIGLIYRFLFMHFDSINWCTVSYLIIYVFSGLLINKVFSKKCTNFTFIYIVLNISYVIVLSYFSFTVVAYYAIIAGCISIIYAINYHIKPYYLSGSFFILTGLLFRAEAMKSIVIVLCAYVIYNWHNKLCLKYIIFISSSLIAMFISIYSNFFLIQINPTGKDYITWGEIRSEALDCAAVPYDAEIFDAQNISYEQYMAMYNAFYYDKEHVSTSDFEKLIHLNSSRNKYNLDIISFFQQELNTLKPQFNFSYLYIFCGLLAIVYFLVQSFTLNNKREILAFWLLLMLLITDTLFFVIQRRPYRVIMPNYVLFALLLCFELQDIPRRDTRDTRNTLTSHLRYAALLLFLLPVLLLRIYNNDLLSDEVTSDERRYVLNYITENNDCLYIAGDPRVFSLDVSRSIWDYTANHGYWNIMGNWEIYSIPYYNLMQIYNINNPDCLLLESLENENILILTSFGSSFEDDYSYIISYIKTYYDIDVSFELVEKLTTANTSLNPDECWSIYRLKKLN